MVRLILLSWRRRPLVEPVEPAPARVLGGCGGRGHRLGQAASTRTRAAAFAAAGVTGSASSTPAEADHVLGELARAGLRAVTVSELVTLRCHGDHGYSRSAPPVGTSDPDLPAGPLVAWNGKARWGGRLYGCAERIS
jgi:hypothetical protein